MKANSLPGLVARRQGTTVTFTVAARAWNNAITRHQGRPRQGVQIQKHNSSGTWATVGGVTTDRNGNASTTSAAARV